MESGSDTRMVRTEPRLLRAAEVTVYGLDGNGRAFYAKAETIDISPRGARLQQVRRWNAPGEIIAVRCGNEKARFRVVWIGAAGSAEEGEIGITCLDPARYIWEAVVPAVEFIPAFTRKNLQEPEVMSNAPEPNRRRALRCRTTGRVQVRELGAERWHWAVLCDLSQGGCSLEMPVPFKTGTKVEAVVNVGGTQLYLQGQVVASRLRTGMSVRFTHLDNMDTQRLQRVIGVLLATYSLL